MKRGLPIQERIKANVAIDPETGCWIWQGSLRAGSRYGNLQHDGKLRVAHRVSYEAFVGPVPEGLELDHLCRVRACVNPEHLEAVTHQTNVLRGISPSAENAAKTHCPRNHPYDEENTYRGWGRRYCRECNRIKSRAHYARMKAAKA